MKVTIQFKNDSDYKLNENVDIEIPSDVMEQFEKIAKDHNTSVDSVISFYLTGILRQMESEAMQEQEAMYFSR